MLGADEPESNVTAITADEFSYADPADPPLKRFVIHAIEALTGQPYLRWLYESYRTHPVAGETFWDAAIRLLELKVVCDAARLAAWPRTGPLVVVCNHPFGVLDGVVSCAIVARVRPDFKVLTNAVICRAEELRPYLLPIDFSETREATRTNIRSRNLAKEHVAAGGCLLIFPSGAVSTTPAWYSARAVDPEWKTFAAGIVAKTHAAVAPLYFAGQNSMLFQLVSHISLTLRLSLLFYEVHNKLGSEVRAGVGDVIPYERLATFRDRAALIQHLREATYALANGVGEPPRDRVKRPRRVPPPGYPVPGIA
ncbi:MAG TPA: lysophospholipid acyltransferase family protein [Rhizomicrobium sp.]|nr:lysophospholipid acyltransferase family protein [Rhizomicrobium sp.]